MANATKEMIKLCNDYMVWCAERNVEMIAKYSVDDDQAGYVGIHTTPGEFDTSLKKRLTIWVLLQRHNL